MWIWRDLPNVPPFLSDIFLTIPSIKGPARRVASTDATKDEIFVSPTEVTEKLYGGAEKICESVTEIPTSHEMQVVKSSVAQRTAGEASMTKGRKVVLMRETWLTYPLQGFISCANVYGLSEAGLAGLAGLLVGLWVVVPAVFSSFSTCAASILWVSVNSVMTCL